ncbi:MAG TPA: glycosyltransferase family 1 protein [Candidatus Thermoplasmatota archaeon]|nr:glycosyltransferase family 1 protein [Candidatus Thermoplasmatota archaeon]
MRVALVSARNALATGVDRYAREIERALAREGLETLPVALARRELRIGSARLGGFASLWAQRFLPRRGEADLVHALDPAVATLRTDVLTVHDLLQEAHPDVYLRGARARADERLNRILARRVPWLVCVSEATRQEVLRRWDADPARVAVSHHGIDHERFRPVDAPSPHAAEGAPTLAYVGDDNPRKNLPLAVEAVAQLRERHGVEVRLVRVGPTRFGGAHAALAKERGVDLVEPGFLDDDALVALLSRAGAFVWPTLGEGFGFPPLEAMACGAPVAALDIPVNREVLGDLASYHDNDAGACADALARTLRAPPAKDALVAHARRFTWQASARRLMAVYDLALASRRRA